MQLNLHSIMSHKSFDWRCRGSKAALLQNLVLVVMVMGSFSQEDSSISSHLLTAASKIYDMTRKPRYSHKSLQFFLEKENDALQEYMIEIKKKPNEDEDVDGGESKEKDELHEKKHKKSGVKRKAYSELGKQRKKQRRSTVIHQIREDNGLEDDLFEELKVKKNSSGYSGEDEAFKLACLNLMKTLGLSSTKYNDLRWWVKDVMKRGLNLSAMPTARVLKAKIAKEMVPPNMKTSEQGAHFDMVEALFHTGSRFLVRQDVKENLKEEGTVIHLAKVGSDFASGFGKLNQKKNTEFDEDGSHNTGFQTLKLCQGGQTLFENESPGGSELLRLVSKTTHKDTPSKMVEDMEALDKICKEKPVQEVVVEGLGTVKIEHHLVNSLHDGKERLAMTQHKVGEQ